MNDQQFAAARQALAEARRAARRIDPVAPEWVPQGLDEAFRLQGAVAADLGSTRGWKVSAVTADQQRQLGLECPIAGALLEPWIRPSGGSFELARFIAPRLECEFAFELKHALPGREAAWSRAEVEAAIGALRIVIEVVDSRLPPGSPVWLELADDLNNGGFVVGPATPDWRGVRYAQQAIVLRGPRDGAPSAELARGTGAAVLDGDPVGAVVLLANLASMRGRGLRAGDIVTTGSCTGALPVTHAGDYEADFGTLGSVRIRLAG